jgi:hypothetical protein
MQSFFEQMQNPRPDMRGYSVPVQQPMPMPQQEYYAEKPISTPGQRWGAMLTGAGAGMRNGGGFAGGAAGLAQAAMALADQDRNTRQAILRRQAAALGGSQLANAIRTNGEIAPGMLMYELPEGLKTFAGQFGGQGERQAAGAYGRYYTGDENAPDADSALVGKTMADYSTNAQNYANLQNGRGAFTVGNDAAQNGGEAPTQTGATQQPAPTQAGPTQQQPAPAQTPMAGLTPMQQMALKAIQLANKNNQTNIAAHDFLGMIDQESGYNPVAVSRTNNKGLGQLSDGLISHYGIKDWRDPQANLNASAQYLAENYRAGGGKSINNALAGYFGGPGGQKSYMNGGNLSDPNIDTRGHINKVAEKAKKYKGGQALTGQQMDSAITHTAPTAASPLQQALGLDATPYLNKKTVDQMFSITPQARQDITSNKPLNPYNPQTRMPETDKLMNVAKEAGAFVQKNEDQSINNLEAQIDNKRADNTNSYNQQMVQYLKDNMESSERKNKLTADKPTDAQLRREIWNNATPAERKVLGAALFRQKDDPIQDLINKMNKDAADAAAEAAKNAIPIPETQAGTNPLQSLADGFFGKGKGKETKKSPAAAGRI